MRSFYLFFYAKEKTPLIAFVECQNIENLRKFLEIKNCRVNNQTSKEKISALHKACEVGNLEIVEILCEHGADVTQVDVNNRSIFLFLFILNFMLN